MYADDVADTNAGIKTIISPEYICMGYNIRSQKCDYHYNLPQPLKYMFRYLNQVPMCSESEDTAKRIFSAPFGGHLEFIQIIFRLKPSCFPAILSPISILRIQ